MALAACGGGGGASSTGTGSIPTGTTVVASQVVDSSGGIVSVTDATSPISGTQVVIPAGALSGPTTITISHVTGASGLPRDVLVAGLGPTGTVFSVPVSVTIRYAPQYLASNGISDPTTLKVVVLESGTANETLRTVSQDSTLNSVTAQTTRFSHFGVVGYTNASLSGSYAFMFYIIDARFGPLDTLNIDIPSTPYNSPINVPFPEYAFNTELGTVTFDGAGNYSWSGIRNGAGVPRAVSGSGTYSVTADGTMTLDFGLAGTVLAGGSTFVLSAIGGEVIEMGVGVKKGGTFGNASLTGSYAVAYYYSDATAGPPNTITIDVAKTPYSNPVNVPFPGYAFNSELRTVMFDGAGHYTSSGTRNRGGVSSAVSGSGTYSVAADGAMTLDGGLTGTVLAGGSTFILVSPSAQPIEIGVGLKKGGTFSNASLGGTYAVAYHYADAVGGPANTININIPNTPYISTLDVPFPGYAFNSELRTITFNGTGSYTWSGTRDRGGVSSPISGSGTYLVAADGALTLEAGLAGNVLEGASTFILATTSGPAVKIGVGVLK